MPESPPWSSLRSWPGPSSAPWPPWSSPTSWLGPSSLCELPRPRILRAGPVAGPVAVVAGVVVADIVAGTIIVVVVVPPGRSRCPRAAADPRSAGRWRARPRRTGRSRPPCRWCWWWPPPGSPSWPSLVTRRRGHHVGRPSNEDADHYGRNVLDMVLIRNPSLLWVWRPLSAARVRRCPGAGNGKARGGLSLRKVGRTPSNPGVRHASIGARWYFSSRGLRASEGIYEHGSRDSSRDTSLVGRVRLRGRRAACDLTRGQGGGERPVPGDRRQARRRRPTSTTRMSSTSPTATGRQHYARARTSSGSDRRSTAGQKLWPQEDGYITRFDPELIYADGTVPRVDVLHLHHAVWAVNGNPQFAVGEEKTIQQLPQGFGWREPSRRHLDPQRHAARPRRQGGPGLRRLADRLRPADLARPTRPINRAHQVDGCRREPEHLSGLRRAALDGKNGRYTFPDQAPAADLHPCGSSGRAPDTHGCLGAAQRWTPNQDVTLIATAGHLHPGGLDTQLRDTRDGTDQHPLHLQRPLLRAGGRGLMGRRDGRARRPPGGCR